MTLTDPKHRTDGGSRRSTTRDGSVPGREVSRTRLIVPDSEKSSSTMRSPVDRSTKPKTALRSIRGGDCAITPRTRAISSTRRRPDGAGDLGAGLAEIADAAATRGTGFSSIGYEKIIYDNAPHNVVKLLTDGAGRTILCDRVKGYSIRLACGGFWSPRIVAARHTQGLRRRSRVDLQSGRQALSRIAGSGWRMNERIQNKPPADGGFGRSRDSNV